MDDIITDGWLSPNDPRSSVDAPPTSGQKWWISVLLGFIFAIISSGVAYQITSNISGYFDGKGTIKGSGPTLIGLTIHTIIFILIVRLLLW